MSRHEAIATAAKYGLVGEVIYEMDHNNATPEEALSEWDILQQQIICRGMRILYYSQRTLIIPRVLGIWIELTQKRDGMIGIFSSREIAESFGLDAALRKAFICKVSSFEELALIKRDLKSFEFIALVDNKAAAERTIAAIISGIERL